MKFSIVVPIGAYHPFLPYCLRSLATQREVALEVALMDASGDQRVTALAQEYSDLLTYIHHGPDDGQSDAILNGWKNLSGDILGWLNADDMLFPDALNRVAQAFSSTGRVDVVYGQSSIVDEEDNFRGYQWAVEPPGDRLLESAIISQPSCFFRKTAYDKAGGLDRNLHYTMDWDLFIRLFKSGAEFQYIEEILSKVMWGKNTKTASFEGGRKEELKRLIDNHAPPDKREKIMRSFSIHHFLEGLRPDAVQNLVTRGLVRGRKVFYGLAADGSVVPPFILNVLHYDTAEKSAIELRFRKSKNVEQILIDGVKPDVKQTNHGFVLTPDHQFKAGEVYRVEVRTKPDKPCWFLSSAWI
ncbi:MAG: glycosyltransferase [Pseudomonadota bacterium]